MGSLEGNKGSPGRHMSFSHNVQTQLEGTLCEPEHGQSPNTAFAVSLISVFPAFRNIVLYSKKIDKEEGPNICQEVGCCLTVCVEKIRSRSATR